MMQHIVFFMGKSNFLENTLIANLVCFLVDFILNVNSLRPSDAYKRRYKYQHWFR